MTEFTFYVAPLLIGLASGLVRGIQPQKMFRIPANDVGPANTSTGTQARVAANDSVVRAMEA